MNLNNLLILYIHDEDACVDEILSVLNANVKKVFSAKGVKKARSAYKKYSPCIVLVEDSFINDDMITFLQEIRQNDIKTAFIVATNNQKNPYMYDLMELYLTKYLIKPLSKEELVMALNRCLEVIQTRIYSHVYLGNSLFFNFQTQTITKDSHVIVLNKKESILVNLFIQNPHRIITYEELEYHIWDNDCTTAALKTLIRDFRKKTYKTILKNYSQIGYKLNIEG